jgi:hypothetical protein
MIDYDARKNKKQMEKTDGATRPHQMRAQRIWQEGSHVQ